MLVKLPCPVCDESCSPLDVVDFNKSCEEPQGRYLPLAGIPVYYFFCDECGFCFAPEFAQWTAEDFARKIYNSDYVEVDPGYLDTRPRANANTLLTLFGNRSAQFKHLDYGGGGGLLSELLQKSNWQSSSYDPFVNRDVRPDALGKFDLITAFEVFEHVPDVLQLISNLSALLAPDGIVLFSTMVSDDQLKRGQRINWWYAAPRNGHISLFSKTSLILLGAKEGFNFDSLSEGFHAYWRKEIPPWARHVIQAG